MSLTSREDFYDQIKEEGTFVAELEDNLVRQEICKLSGIKDVQEEEEAALLLRKKMKQQNSVVHGEKEDIIAQLHVSLWPKNDLKSFQSLLEQHPLLVDSKFGKSRDTLLIRSVVSSRLQFLVFFYMSSF